MGSNVKRNSSVELLKVIAICLIVISHTTQSVGSTSNSLLGKLASAVSYKTASKDVNAVILMVFRHFGAIGNVIFMVCSSWFLVDGKRTDYKKVFRMIFEVWMISVLILLFSYLGRPSENL